MISNSSSSYGPLLGEMLRFGRSLLPSNKHKPTLTTTATTTTTHTTKDNRRGHIQIPCTPSRTHDTRCTTTTTTTTDDLTRSTTTTASSSSSFEVYLSQHGDRPLARWDPIAIVSGGREAATKARGRSLFRTKATTQPPPSRGAMENTARDMSSSVWNNSSPSKTGNRKIRSSPASPTHHPARLLHRMIRTTLAVASSSTPSTRIRNTTPTTTTECCPRGGWKVTVDGDDNVEITSSEKSDSVSNHDDPRHHHHPKQHLQHPRSLFVLPREDTSTCATLAFSSLDSETLIADRPLQIIDAFRGGGSSDRGFDSDVDRYQRNTTTERFGDDDEEVGFREPCQPREAPKPSGGDGDGFGDDLMMFVSNECKVLEYTPDEFRGYY